MNRLAAPAVSTVPDKFSTSALAMTATTCASLDDTTALLRNQQNHIFDENGSGRLAGCT
jgi:hypothetical protein